MTAELDLVDGWQQHATCRGMDPAWFFPGRGENLSGRRAVCAACPVLEQCREEHIDERQGFFGGMSDRERRRFRKERRLAEAG